MEEKSRRHESKIVPSFKREQNGARTERKCGSGMGIERSRKGAGYPEAEERRERGEKSERSNDTDAFFKRSSV